MKLKISDDRRNFYQWDKDQKLIATGIPAGSEAHFTNPKTKRMISEYSSFKEYDGDRTYCDIPSVLFQEAGKLGVYIYVTDEHGARTTVFKEYEVTAREKPPTYIYYNTADEAVSAHNAGILAMTGTEQSTAEDAVAEINATLADALTGKGIEAKATETTEALVGKVGQIHDWVAEQSKKLDFGEVELYDETALKHFPNMYCPKLTSITFQNNKAVETIGDIYAPNATCPNANTPSIVILSTNVKRIGKLYFPNAYITSKFLYDNVYLEEVESLTFGPCNIVGGVEVGSCFYGCPKLKRIGGEIDMTNIKSSEWFRGSANCTEVRFKKNTMSHRQSFAYFMNPSYETLRSIIEALVDLTGQTQQTLMLYSQSAAKLTTEDKLEILAKNWLLK